MPVSTPAANTSTRITVTPALRMTVDLRSSEKSYAIFLWILLWNHNRCLTRVHHLDHSAPGTHQLRVVVERGKVRDQHRRRAGNPGRRKHRNTRHRGQHSQCGGRGGRDGWVGE